MSDQATSESLTAALDAAHSGFSADIFASAQAAAAETVGSPAAEPAAPTPPPPAAPAAPAPSPVPPPAPPAAAPVAPVPPVAPTHPAAAVPPPTSVYAIDRNNLSPEAQKFLDMFGGDVNAAAAAALGYNNRLSELSRAGVNVHPGQPGAPGSQAAPGPASPSTALQVTDQQFQAAVSSFEQKDHVCLALSRNYDAVYNQLYGADGTPEAPAPGSLEAMIPTLEKDLERAQWKLTLPEISGDEYKLEDATKEVARLRSELVTLKGERREARADKVSLLRQYGDRRQSYADFLRGEINAEERAANERAESVQRETDAAEALHQAWKPTLTAAMATAGLDPELYDSFDSFCRRSALANQERGVLVDDAAALAAEWAQEYQSMVDAHHRVRSKQHAVDALHRTQQVTDGNPPAVIPQDPSNAPASGGLDGALERAKAGFKADIRAILR